jgi:hypothetical protein
MNNASHHAIPRPSLPAFAGFVAVLACMSFTVPVRAADPIFPTGSRLGLVPPPGMVQSTTFQGFTDLDKNAAIFVAVLPAAAYAELEKTMVPETMQKQGIDVDKREPITLGANKGFILSGKQSSPKGRYRKWLMVAAASDLTALVTAQVPEQDQTYSDQAIHDALATLALRANVPDEERLSLLPFKIDDLAGFHIEDVVPGNALMLVDTSADQETGASDPARKTHLLIAALPGGPAEAADRASFARVMFDQIGGIKEIRVQDAGPLRIGGQPGFQILAKAKEGQTDADIMVVQWLRFGSGGFMQMIGIARADIWLDVFSRLRTVRDSVDPRR